MAALIITLLCILLISAGAFYEVERLWGYHEEGFGLQFHDAIYWAAVTISTVGGTAWLHDAACWLSADAHLWLGAASALKSCFCTAQVA